jgi:tetratricopeptide (TPR) repeat protein
LKRIVGGLAVVALAAALFGAGALAPLEPEASLSASGSSPRTEAAALEPAADARKVDTTITSLQQRLRTYGDDAPSYASLGLAYLQKARVTADPSYYPRAEGTLRKSLRLDGSENFRALLGMGVLAAARHDFSRALEWARRAKSANPYNADVRGVLGDALVELGRYRAAERAFQGMIDLRPDVASYARVSYFRELHGDIRGAIKGMRLAGEAALATPQDGAWIAYQLGELYFGSGRLAAARREFRKGAWLAPGYELPHAGLAKVAAARGKTERAIRILSKVVARYPSPEFVILLGDLYRLEGAERRASTQYELVESIAELYRANGVNSDLEMALFAADHRLGGRSTVSRARSVYLSRPSIQAADALAWALYAQGSYRAADGFAREALRLGTRNALYYFHRGMIARRLGERDEGRRFIEAAIDLNPHFSFRHSMPARRVLRHLKGAGA